MPDHADTTPAPLRLEPVDPASPDHIATIFDMHSRLEIIRWLDDEPWEPFTEREQAIDLLRERAEAERADPHQRHRMIRDTATAQVVGHVGVKRLIRHDEGFVGEYEIGWTLRPGSAGHGYATRAGRMLAQETFVGGLDLLHIDMWADNEPSARVARRLGATELGVIEDPWYTGTSRLFHLRPEHVVGQAA